MPSKQQLVEDLTIALRDQRVLDALANVFESKQLSVVTKLTQENQRQSERIVDRSTTI